MLQVQFAAMSLPRNDSRQVIHTPYVSAIKFGIGVKTGQVTTTGYGWSISSVVQGASSLPAQDMETEMSALPK